MSSSSILRFQPIYQSRIWGGRRLETKLGRKLPDDSTPFGESWEISAREEADSKVISPGKYEGQTLTEIWSNPESKNEIFGPDAPNADRFPLLCKILDAQDKLSIQVHPPTEIAEKLNGEPKTEVWYIAGAEKDAKLYVGVKSGVTEAGFRTALENGTAEDQVHVLHPAKGDFIFIESGRLHAIGAGLLIYEIQQNSDTTYRVYDWNRVGLDGAPRQLHIEESLMCIDFDDVEPELDSTDNEVLCECEHFRLEEHSVTRNESINSAVAGRFAILTVVEGEIAWENETAREGDFLIVPHGATTEITATSDATVLLTTW
ncbi:MAG: class I mannose-6-phosphate isomerase [Verrucomicrobiales bacterium]|nr:class I mannose-6-phosphate isomerase [Verrucomicrobiales bacterium]